MDIVSWPWINFSIWLSTTHQAFIQIKTILQYSLFHHSENHLTKMTIFKRPCSQWQAKVKIKYRFIWADTSLSTGTSWLPFAYEFTYYTEKKRGLWTKDIHPKLRLFFQIQILKTRQCSAEAICFLRNCPQCDKKCLDFKISRFPQNCNNLTLRQTHSYDKQK